MRVRIILLHGYGGDGEEMMRSFGPSMHDLGYECEAPDAPFPCDLIPDKYQWFGLTTLPDILAKRVRQAADDLAPHLHGAGNDTRTIFIGHSQGAMIAAELISRQQIAGARAVCVAGSLSFAPQFPKKALNRIIFVHGTADDMIPLAELESRLERSGTPDRLLRVNGSAHALDGPILSQAIDATRILANDAVEVL